MAQQPFMQPSRYSPLRLSSNLLFVVGATSFVVLLGWLVNAGVLPGIAAGTVPLQTTLPAWGVVAFGVWMILAVITSVILPLLALGYWHRQHDVRAVLVPYLGLLLVQIPTEILFAQLFFPNIVAVTGIVYTTYRVYQLWYAHQIVRQHWLAQGRTQAISTLLLVGLCFWAANFAFLVFMLLTRVVPA